MRDGSIDLLTMKKSSPRRRLDPGRRDRIIDAAVECIAEDGVAGISHRRVAVRAEVPLGSMTYHFASMDELLEEAFQRFAHTSSAGLVVLLESAAGPTEALDLLVEHIHGTLQSKRNQVLLHELYALAERRHEYRPIIQTWMRASTATLGAHFPPDIARALDDYVEGASLHIHLDDEPQGRDVTRRILGAIAQVESDA